MVAAHVVESPFPENASPVLFDFGDPVAGVVERLAAMGGGEDQLGAPVVRVRAPLEVTEPLQIADEFGGGGQAQLCPGRQVREPDAVDADVAEDVQMGFAQVGVSVLTGGGEQFGPEVPEQAAQELADRKAVGGQIS